MTSILKEQRGSVAVLVALAMVGLLGVTALVVDVGMLYMTRAQLVAEADAAALAGVPYLKNSTSQAVAKAQEYATNNAASNGQAGDAVSPTVGAGNTSLTVSVARTVNLLFAQVFGLTTQNVTATATAAYGGVGGASGAAPLGVDKQEFKFDRTYELKTGSGGGQGSGAEEGNYNALALGGTGSTNYGYNLLNGYQGIIRVGETVTTEPGAKVGDTRSNVEARINNNDRIVILPILDPATAVAKDGGRFDIQVCGFAAFYLDSMDGNGRIFGRFIGNYYSSNTIPGNGTDYGLYNMRLTQ